MFLSQVAQRSTCVSRDLVYRELPSSLFLSSNRDRKKVLIQGTLIFNESPKKGIPFLQGIFLSLRNLEHGFIQTPLKSSDIAEFLVQNQFVDKKLLGLYLAKPDNQEILKEFVNRLGFKGVYFTFIIIIETYR